MLISDSYPDSPAPSQLRGMGMLPFGEILNPIGSVVSSIVTAKSNEKIAKKMAKIRQLEIMGQKEEAAREFALLQAMKQNEAAEKARNSQIYALYAVGGAAALIAGLMLFSMTRNK